MRGIIGYIKNLLASFDKRKLKKFAIPAAVVVAIIVVVLLIVNFSTYTDYSVSSEIEVKNEIGETIYIPLGSGYAKYSNDGVSYFSGNEIVWTNSFEMTNPVYDSNSNYIAVADLKSNEIFLFDSAGLVNKITTSYPVIDVEVANQGVVAALMEEENVNYIELKDKDGNLLGKGRSAFESSGYPMDLAISPDGKTLAASYLYVSSGFITSKVVFYDYTDAGDTYTDRIKAGFDFDDTVIPTLCYIDDSTVCAVGDNVFATFSASGKVKEIQRSEIKNTIKSVFFGEGMVGLAMASENGSTEKEIKVFDKNGKEQGNIVTDFKYNDIQLIPEGVLMYSTNAARIYGLSGREKFKKEFDTTLAFMTQVGSLNKYIIATSDKMMIARLK